MSWAILTIIKKKMHAVCSTTPAAPAMLIRAVEAAASTHPDPASWRRKTCRVCVAPLLGEYLGNCEQEGSAAHSMLKIHVQA